MYVPPFEGTYEDCYVPPFEGTYEDCYVPPIEGTYEYIWPLKEKILFLRTKLRSILATAGGRPLYLSSALIPSSCVIVVYRFLTSMLISNDP